MNYILYDGAVREALLPFTYTKPVADLRIGILTIREKWEKYLGFTTTTLTEDYLEAKYPMVEMEQNIMINASFLPTENLVAQLLDLKEEMAIVSNGEIVAFYTTSSQEEVDFETYTCIEAPEGLIQLKHTWDFFSRNDEALRADFELLSAGRKSMPIPDSVRCSDPSQVFIEEGAELSYAVLNASTGPIYIGKEAVVMEGALIRGPFALGEQSIVKMGAKIYGATTIGPKCSVGGEVQNSVLMGYSGKGHEGYLGNSVLGEYCNIGADSNNSNLKNNYANVRMWDYGTERFADTELQFCGLIMGDHSKCAINTMFNTGTVVGVSANIFGSNFPRNFIPSFSWGGAAGFSTYGLDKACATAELVLQRKHQVFDAQERRILSHVFEITRKYRKD